MHQHVDQDERAVEVKPSRGGGGGGGGGGLTAASNTLASSCPHRPQRIMQRACLKSSWMPSETQGTRGTPMLIPAMSGGPRMEAQHPR